MIVLEIILTIIAMMYFHELGHLLAAKIMNLEVLNFNMKRTPFPHFSITVNNKGGSRFKNNIFLVSGSFFSIIGFFILSSFGLLELHFIIIAYKMQLILETNPFLSDITIFFNDQKNKDTDDFYKLYSKNSYLFSYKWYIHLIFWCALIIFIFKK